MATPAARSKLYSHYIADGYVGVSGAFASGVVVNGDAANYTQTLGHLRTVLDAAWPGGDAHWGHAGISVTEWRHAGRPVEGGCRTFATRAEFEAALQEAGVAL